MLHDIGPLPGYVKTYSDLIAFAAFLERMTGKITFFYHDAEGRVWRVWPRDAHV